MANVGRAAHSAQTSSGRAGGVGSAGDGGPAGGAAGGVTAAALVVKVASSPVDVPASLVAVSR
jgi:hypothetical protein